MTPVQLIASLFHLFTFIWHIFMNPLPAIWPPPSSHCWAQLILPSQANLIKKNNYLNWQEKCFLATYLHDGLKVRNCCIMREKLILIASAFGELQHFE